MTDYLCVQVFYNRLLFLLFFLLGQVHSVIADDCDEQLTIDRANYTTVIEAEFERCKKNKACIEKVKKKSKNRPYISDYKKCKKMN
ncbi:MAG: hypothetical protein N0E54_06340 [Candidatus Thiodiazotropha taylori]|nr:hypothetical protein [Candidatus Thiodiazotropha endolucinida]MCW4228339.1 hypothetical protein [Candidatus Thiodiazotropha taylori]